MDKIVKEVVFIRLPSPTAPKRNFVTIIVFKIVITITINCAKSILTMYHSSLQSVTTPGDQSRSRSGLGMAETKTGDTAPTALPPDSIEHGFGFLIIKIPSANRRFLESNNGSRKSKADLGYISLSGHQSQTPINKGKVLARIGNGWSLQGP